MRIRVDAMVCVVAAVGLIGAMPAAAGEPETGGTAVAGAVEDGGAIVGTVVETMSAAHYTYIKVDTGESEVWTVGPRTAVAVGDAVVLSSASLMVDFRSILLDRIFERIYMVASIERQGNEAAPADAPAISPQAPEHAKYQSDAGSFGDGSGIERAEGGLTIAEIVRDKDQLAGQPVLVRGRVASFSAEILKRNWIRLTDATTSQEGRTDLVVTTNDTAAIGDVVLIRGIVATKQDLGYGYVYDVLIEKARLVTESPETVGAGESTDRP